MIQDASEFAARTPRRLMLPMEEPSGLATGAPVSTTQPVGGVGAILPEGQDPYSTGTPFHPGDPKANPTPMPITPEQIENDRRRMGSMRQGYGWGGRRPGGFGGGLGALLGGNAAQGALGAQAGPSLREALMRLLKGGQ